MVGSGFQWYYYDTTTSTSTTTTIHNNNNNNILGRNLNKTENIGNYGCMTNIKSCKLCVLKVQGQAWF